MDAVVEAGGLVPAHAALDVENGGGGVFVQLGERHTVLHILWRRFGLQFN